MQMDMGSTATDGASMSMPTSSSDMMMAGPMPVVFVTSTTTSLWSSSFTPSTIGQYAGICIFLIMFATIFRFLIAFRVNFFDIMAAAEQRRNGGLLHPYATEGKLIARPWRAREAVMTGFMDVTIAGVSYLLSVQIAVVEPDTAANLVIVCSR